MKPQRIDETLNLRIMSPKSDIFSGNCRSVSSINSAGKFDILPEHANFITLVEQQPIVVVGQDYKKLSFKFKTAIIFTQNNQVKIYTDVSQISTIDY